MAALYPHTHREYFDWCFRCQLSRDEVELPDPDPFACGNCGATMEQEHAHYRCGVCGWVEGCCDGKPL